MKEVIPTGPSQEELQNRADEERLQDFLGRHPELLVKEQIDTSSEIAKAEALMADFESKFDLEALNAILTEEEARASELRTAARDALDPIAKVIRPLIEDENNISPDVRATLKERWKKLSNAVGHPVSGRLLHYSRS